MSSFFLNKTQGGRAAVFSSFFTTSRTSPTKKGECHTHKTISKEQERQT